MNLDVDIGRDAAYFDLGEWRDLLGRDPERHIFATPEWSRAWWEEFPKNKDLLVLTLRRDGESFAIAPLYRKNDPGRQILRFVGGLELTDYLGPICSPEDRDQAAAGLIDWLLSTDEEWDTFDAHNLPVPLGFADQLVDHADRSRLNFSIEQEEITGILELPPSWDAYLTALEGKERHELRRKLRRLEREASDAAFRSATEDSLAHDLKIFFAMHRGTEGHKGHFMRPEIATFFTRVAEAFMPHGRLRLDFLELAGRPVAATFGLRYEDTFYLYNSAYEPDLARLSPGLVLVAHLVQDAIDAGVKKFDFLRGPERYKFELGATPVPLHNVRIANPRAR
ncbi:MAG: GNAT family N-acetyltransferase [Actinomycetota bacterium]